MMPNGKTSNLALVISAEEASLSNQAYSQIEEMIVTMQLAPETPVSEAQLSAFLGIGRTPIREAIQRLSRTLGDDRSQARNIYIRPQYAKAITRIRNSP